MIAFELCSCNFGGCVWLLQVLLLCACLGDDFGWL